jgi:hypothetical protein
MGLFNLRSIVSFAGRRFTDVAIKCIVLCTALTLSYSSFAQTGTIAGRVIDATSLAPLPFANVFINNTTIGTATDVSGNFVLNVPAGTHEVVFSSIGYNAYQARYNVAEKVTTTVNIKLSTSQQILDEVSVKAGRDKTWERQLRKFEKIFFGDDEYGRKCAINNAWVIDFKSDGQKLTATAALPIEIVNKAMGYKMNFHLKEFTTDGANYTIVGNTKYEELPADDVSDAMIWTKQRQLAYSRSVRHLLKALIDGRVAEEGFRLYKDVNVAAPVRSKSFNHELEKNVVPYKPVSIVGPGNTIYELKIQMKHRIEVHYLNEPTRNYFYEDVGHSVSWLESSSGFVRVTREGVVLNPKDLIVSGDVSLGRVSEMLPLDFIPGKAVVVESSRTYQAARFEEKSYLHINKPYFYAGDFVWFKAYLGHRDISKADSLSKVVYVELVSPDLQVIQSRVLRADTVMYGEFLLPASTDPGLYSIRAYTNWMLNYGLSYINNVPLPVLDHYEKFVGTDRPPVKPSSIVDIQTDKPAYGKREQVTLSVALRDEDNQPMDADLSVSVIDLQQVHAASWSKSIEDVLMFEKEAIVPGGKFTYRPEQGISICGQFLNERGKPIVDALMVVQGNFEAVYRVDTDVSGKFVVNDLNFFDSVQFAFQPGAKGLQRGHIALSKRTVPEPGINAGSFKYETVREQTRQYAPYKMPGDAIMLKEVSIRATRYERDKPPGLNLYGHAEKIFKREELISKGATLGQVLQSLMPGHSLVLAQDHWFFIRQRSILTIGASVAAQTPVGVSEGEEVRRTPNTPAYHTEPMLVIDNVPFFSGTGETVGDRLQSLNTSDVERVEVNSVVTSTTGAVGASGVINIFLNRVSPEAKKTFLYARQKGYDIPNRFYGPNYADNAEDHSQNDWRSALYWNPTVRTNTTAGTSVTFFTSDLPGAYLVIVEGMTSNGTPVRAEHRFEVSRE